jgi:hypothetical protein
VIEDLHEPTSEQPEGDIEAEWADLARQLPNKNTGENVDPRNNLALWEMDLIDWSDRAGIYSDIMDNDWWKLAKSAHSMLPGSFTTGVVSANSLELKQRVAYNRFVDHCEVWSHHAAHGDRCANNPLMVHMDGEGGTGKTTVVRAICAGLDRQAANNGWPCPVLCAAPKGVASHNIGGQTLHSIFRLSVKKGILDDLMPVVLKSVQARFKHINYLIIDEKSMVGLMQLSWIHRRLQQIFASDVDFGDISIFLLGDLCQLPPVGAAPSFSTAPHKNNSSDYITGQRLYKLLDVIITLDVIKRQGGDDDKIKAFRLALSNLRMNKVSRSFLLVTATRLTLSVYYEGLGVVIFSSPLTGSPPRERSFCVRQHHPHLPAS